MLSKRDLKEMQALVTRAQKGSATREDWSKLAALTLVFQGDATVMAIAHGGYEEFKRVSAPIYELRNFHEDDYQYIYTRICAAAARVERDLVH